jgi:hypothetical protein
MNLTLLSNNICEERVPLTTYAKKFVYHNYIGLQQDLQEDEQFLNLIFLTSI